MDHSLLSSAFKFTSDPTPHSEIWKHCQRDRLSGTRLHLIHFESQLMEIMGSQQKRTRRYAALGGGVNEMLS